MQIRIEPLVGFQRDYLHSRLITIFRGLAALEVFLAHNRNRFFPDFKTVDHPSLIFKGLVFLTGYGPQAVTLFFVMSGWLVGGSLYNRRHEKHEFINYAIDRISRLWVVLLPTMVFSLVTGVFLLRYLNVPDVLAESDLTLSVFLGNLAGLQIIQVPDYGNNLALWSLANETWYYVAFPLMLLPLVGRFSRLGKALSALALVAMPFFLSTKLILYMLIWLVGVLFSRITISVKWPGIALSILVWVSAVLVIRWFRWDSQFGPDFAVGLLFAVFLACTKFPAGEWGDNRPFRFAEKLSAMSYSLYAVHVPIMFFLLGITGLWARKLDQSRPVEWLIFISFLAGGFTFAYTFHMLFESQTYRVRNFLKVQFGLREAFL